MPVAVHAGEPLDGLGRRLHHAARLGLEADPHAAAGAGLDALEARRRGGRGCPARRDAVPPHGVRHASGSVETLPPGGVVGQQPGEHRGAVEGVVEPLRAASSRAGRPLLDDRRVERPGTGTR